MDKIFEKPVFFERNRCGRVYTGGKLFHGFFGDAPEDGFLPEEWVASSVKALNKEMAHPKEGVSKIKDSDLYFDEVLAQFPDEMLGKGNKYRILVKLLDSAVRLPAQAHPDKEFSRKHFNSEYGKTESWLVLDTRPDAKIYFGFQVGVNKEVFSKAIDDSESDKDAMERLMKYSYAHKGDLYLVPAKTVHAIGAGCLILEVQEPTDFTIQPEHWCDNYKLNDQEMYIGLDKETAIECFDFDADADTKLTPRVLNNENGVVTEELIGNNDTDCFIVNRITLNESTCTLNVNGSYAVYIVTDGDGTISGDGYSKEIKKGDYFFMPWAAMGKYSINGNIEIVECY